MKKSELKKIVQEVLLESKHVVERKELIFTIDNQNVDRKEINEYKK